MFLRILRSPLCGRLNLTQGGMRCAFPLIPVGQRSGRGLTVPFMEVARLPILIVRLYMSLLLLSSRCISPSLAPTLRHPSRKNISRVTDVFHLPVCCDGQRYPATLPLHAARHVIKNTRKDQAMPPTLILRLAADPAFRTAVCQDPAQTLAPLGLSPLQQRLLHLVARRPDCLTCMILQSSSLGSSGDSATGGQDPHPCIRDRQ